MSSPTDDEWYGLQYFVWKCYGNIASMKKLGVSEVICFLTVFVFWTSTSASMISRHYTVYKSFNNKVFHTDKTVYSTKSALACSTVCGKDCECFGFNSRTRKCHSFEVCSLDDMTSDEVGWKYYIPKFPGERFTLSTLFWKLLMCVRFVSFRSKHFKLKLLIKSDSQNDKWLALNVTLSSKSGPFLLHVWKVCVHLNIRVH
jgi:hypothetical protein